MNKSIMKWDIYEVSTGNSLIQGVKFRGRVRKFGINNKINILLENASDKENVVRFAVPSGEDTSDVEKFILEMVADSKIKLVEKSVENPVLSQLRTNIASRYEI
jgi:acylphosphatase